MLLSNPSLSKDISCRLQKNKASIFGGVLQQGESFDLTLSNPPFHSSLAEAQAGTERKWKNLGFEKKKAGNLNFGGYQNELWCEGGEQAFIGRMIEESAGISERCFWFSSLVSKSESLRGIYKALKKAGAAQVRTIDMAQGQKTSRFVAWSFLNPSRRTEWQIRRWNG
jgi:23S rRNA (adenine1618-N6)-methyltransferase